MTGSITGLYKMVFCDIDGTLIDSKGRISKDTREKIQELDKIGVPFILVSARMPSGIWPIQRELGIRAPIISYGGALILNESGDWIKSAGISVEAALLVKRFVNKSNKEVCCNTFSFDYWIVDNVNDKWVTEEQRITSSLATEGEISDFIAPGSQIHKLLCMGEAEDISSLNKGLKEKFPDFAICRSKDTYLEILDGAVSKSGAVTYLCELYGVSIADTVSFGDNFNDADMLLATGAGFAMGNAPEEVKQSAGHVTLDNDNEGVLAALKKLNFSGCRM